MFGLDCFFACRCGLSLLFRYVLGWVCAGWVPLAFVCVSDLPGLLPRLLDLVWGGVCWLSLLFGFYVVCLVSYRLDPD